MYIIYSIYATYHVLPEPEQSIEFRRGAGDLGKFCWQLLALVWNVRSSLGRDVSGLNISFWAVPLPSFHRFTALPESQKIRNSSVLLTACSQVFLANLGRNLWQLPHSNHTHFESVEKCRTSVDHCTHYEHQTACSFKETKIETANAHEPSVSFCRSTEVGSGLSWAAES